MTTRRTQLTTSAARDLFEAAIAELDESSGAYEIHDLRTWLRRFRSTLSRVADYHAADLELDDPTSGRFPG